MRRVFVTGVRCNRGEKGICNWGKIKMGEKIFVTGVRCNGVRRVFVTVVRCNRGEKILNWGKM